MREFRSLFINKKENYLFLFIKIVLFLLWSLWCRMSWWFSVIFWCVC